MRKSRDEETIDGVRLLNNVIKVGAMAKHNDNAIFFFMDQDLDNNKYKVFIPLLRINIT